MQAELSDFKYKSWYIQVHYSFYHFFVLIKITTLVKAVLGFFVIILFGKLFYELRMRFGYWTASLTHMGADWSVITLALILVYFKDNIDLL